MQWPISNVTARYAQINSSLFSLDGKPAQSIVLKGNLFLRVCHANLIIKGTLRLRIFVVYRQPGAKGLHRGA